MTSSLKSIHDRLLAEKPDNAEHDSENCLLCKASEEDPNANAGERMTTYTEEQVKAQVDEAVKTATAALEAQVRELAEKAKTDEVKSAEEAVRAELEPKVADLQKQLDAAVLEAANAVAETEAIKVWLEGEATAQKEQAVFAARKDERLAKIKEAAPNLPDEYVTANADRFVAMADEDFQAVIAGWEAQSVKGSGDGGPIPTKTALHASRDNSGGSTSAVKELMALRRDQGRQDLTGLTGRK